MDKTKEQIVQDIIDEAYGFLYKKLNEAGIEYDDGSSDCIFYNDEQQKKTFAINFYQHQCEEYEGE